MAGTSHPVKPEFEKKSGVIIVKFKNGHLTSFGKKKVNFMCYKNTNTVKKNISPFLERIVVAKNGKMCYAGSNFETELSKITSTVLKLLVVNKKNESFKMFDVDYFPLAPQFENPEIVQANDEKKTYIEKSSDLTLAFGSKSQQKIISTRKKYSESVTVNSFDNFKVPETESTSTDLPGAVRTPSVIPPQNPSPINADEVYNLYDIISLEELDALTSHAEIFRNATREEIQQWKIENKYTPFITQFIENNINFMDLHKAKLLCYLHYMFCFLRTTFADWRKKDPVPDVPEPFKQKLMDSFTIKKSMPMRLKDKLLAYAIVLGLKVCNYTFNCYLFTSSAKIPMTRMTSVAHALGCHISENKTRGLQMIELKLPLYKFQALPRKRKNP